MLTIWFLITGTLLLLMVLIGTVLKRLPISTAIIYLLIGVALGLYGVGYLRIDPLASAAALEHISEIAVLISLFTVGLKLRVSVFDRAWRLTLRLAGWTMLMTIALITAFAIPTLNMPLGVALLLAAILAPTDPVLASDVQVYDASDRDRVRFGLTGEGGLNDGIAFPFVMLGLGMMGLHDLGEGGVDWLWRDVLWPNNCRRYQRLAVWLLGRPLGDLSASSTSGGAGIGRISRPGLNCVFLRRCPID